MLCTLTGMMIFLVAKFTAEDLELLRLFEIESAANYRQRVEEEKRTGTEARIRYTSERVEHLVKKVTELQETLQLHLTNTDVNLRQNNVNTS